MRQALPTQQHCLRGSAQEVKHQCAMLAPHFPQFASKFETGHNHRHGRKLEQRLFRPRGL